MLTTLFIDFNSYFASVEQHLDPSLRGRAIAVAPVSHDSGCCIAASYEAKAYGVKTGTRVYEARKLCPHIIIVEPRHGVYTELHHALVAAVETVLPVDAVHSIDEMSCRLGGGIGGAIGQRDPATATALAHAVKRAIVDRVGPCLRCSIGIAPNRFLAKLATDMQKPDGLVIIKRDELPERLYPLQLMDLPGIGPRMNDRLQRRGVRTVEQLLALSERQMADLWESVVGRRWYALLRGDDLDEFAARRRSIGHQHVLAPKMRNDDDARAVGLKLLHKAAARARSLGYWPRQLTLRLRFQPPRGPSGATKTGRGESVAGGGWKREHWHTFVHLEHGCQDTLRLIEIFESLWTQRPLGKTISLVDVTFDDLIPEASATQPLFGAERSRIALSKAIDAINRKHGRDAVYTGGIHAHRSAAKGGIAFRNIPDLNNPDSPR